MPKCSICCNCFHTTQISTSKLESGLLKPHVFPIPPTTSDHPTPTSGGSAVESRTSVQPSHKQWTPFNFLDHSQPKCPSRIHNSFFYEHPICCCYLLGALNSENRSNHNEKRNPREKTKVCKDLHRSKPDSNFSTSQSEKKESEKHSPQVGSHFPPGSPMYLDF